MSVYARVFDVARRTMRAGEEELGYKASGRERSGRWMQADYRSSMAPGKIRGDSRPGNSISLPGFPTRQSAAQTSCYAMRLDAGPKSLVALFPARDLPCGRSVGTSQNLVKPFWILGTFAILRDFIGQCLHPDSLFSSLQRVVYQGFRSSKFLWLLLFCPFMHDQERSPCLAHLTYSQA
jgi:hypothetical protein